MTINYRRVNPSEHAADVMKDRALQAEVAAFHFEMEEKRVQRLRDLKPDDAELSDQLIKAPGEAKSQRAKARRAAGAAPLTTEEVIEAREKYLNDWLENIEKDHAAQTALTQEGDRLLGLTGNDALTDEERREVEKDRKIGEGVLREMEAVHALITETLDNLHDNLHDSKK